MPVRMTGAEFKRFVTAKWGPDPMWEDYVIRINGEEVEDYDESTIADADAVGIQGGYVYLDQTNAPRECVDAEKFAKKWLKDQSTVCFVLEVDRERESMIRELIEQMVGAKILGAHRE